DAEDAVEILRHPSAKQCSHSNRSARLSRLGRDDLHPPRVPFARALRAQPRELGESEVHHAPLARAHGIEGDDLALANGLLAELERDRREPTLTTRAVSLDVEHDVATPDRPAVHHAI